MSGLSRDVPVVHEHSALLFIDVQNYNARPDGGEYQQQGLSSEEATAAHPYFFERLERTAVPNMQRLQAGCRSHGIEVIYTVIESLTWDGRDRSLDYKITGFNVPRGSPDARVIDAIAPAADEMIFPKTSSSAFISTNLHYVLAGQSGLVRKAMSKGNLGPTIEFVPVSTAFLGFSVHHASSNRSYSPPSRPTPDR